MCGPKNVDTKHFIVEAFEDGQHFLGVVPYEAQKVSPQVGREILRDDSERAVGEPISVVFVAHAR